MAGVLSLRDACALVAARGRLMQALPAGGAMVAVQATEDEVLALLRGREGQMRVAAVNGPPSVVVSGDEARRWRNCRRLAADGPQDEAAAGQPRVPLAADGADAGRVPRVAQGLTYQAPRIPVVSNLTGRLAEPDEFCSPEYWVRHVREPVRFGDGIRCRSSQGGARVSWSWVRVRIHRDDPGQLPP